MANDDAFPPAPEPRSITPAPEDYAERPKASAYLWPVFWIAATVVLGWVVVTSGWPPSPA